MRTSRLVIGFFAASIYLLGDTKTLLATAGDGWRGTVSGNWSDPNNWDNGFPGGGKGDLYFGGTFVSSIGTYNSTNNDIDNFGAHAIYFDSGGNTAFTLGGKNVSLFYYGDSSPNNAPRIVNSAGSTQIVDLNVAFNNSDSTNNFALIDANAGNLIFNGTVNLATAATQLQISANMNKQITFNSAITGVSANALALNGNGSVVVNATNSYGGPTYLNAGKVRLNSASATLATATIYLGDTSGSNSAELDLTVLSGGQSVSNAIETRSGGSGLLTVASTNATNTNTVSGSITLNRDLGISQSSGGTLALTSNSTDIKNNTLTLAPAVGGTIRLDGVIASSTDSGVPSGTRGVVVADAGTVVLNSSSTYAGDTQVNAGKFQFGSTAAALTQSTIRLGATSGSAAAEVHLTPATGGVTVASTMNPRAGTSGTLTIASQNTSGTNTLSGHIGADHAYTISQAAGGTLNLTAVRSGTTTNTGYDIKSYELTLAAAGNISVNGTIYNSVGSGSVRISGSGTVTLSSANTYTGNTTLDGGKLLANGGGTTDSATGSGTVNVNSGATLAGTGRIAGAVNVNAGSVISAGSGTSNSDTPGTLTNPNTQTWTGAGTTEASGGTYTWKLGSSTADKLEIGLLNVVATTSNKFTFRPLNAGGTVALGSTYTIAHVSGLQVNNVNQATSGSPIDLTDLFYLDLTGVGYADNDSRFKLSAVYDGSGSSFSVQISAAPEPATAGLVGLGAITLLGVRRGRRVAN